MDVTTGILCNVEQNDDHSVVLVTNSCVLSSEEIPAESVIKFNGVDVYVNMNNFVVETSYAFSHKKKVCIEFLCYCIYSSYIVFWATVN